MAKERSEIDVAVVPVAVRQQGWNQRPTLMGWAREDGSWPRGGLAGTADGTAQRLLSGALPPGAELLHWERSRSDRVTFLEETMAGKPRVTLLYTVALPMALADPEAPDNERWVALLKPEAKATEARQVGARMIRDVPYAHELVDYWRGALEGTAGALRFLARYWAMPQLRDVYSAVWGYEQDPAAFSKWAVGRRGALTEAVRSIEDPDLTEELAEALADATTASSNEDEEQETARDARRAAARAASMAAWTALTRTLRSPRGVGLKLGTTAVRGSALPAAAVAGAAAVVAYQASTRGPLPTWYETVVSEPQDHKLERPYTPRPAWLVPEG